MPLSATLLLVAFIASQCRGMSWLLAMGLPLSTKRYSFVPNCRLSRSRIGGISTPMSDAKFRRTPVTRSSRSPPLRLSASGTRP